MVLRVIAFCAEFLNMKCDNIRTAIQNNVLKMWFKQFKWCIHVNSVMSTNGIR